MLEELLPRERMRKTESVVDFEEAIELASQPLLEEGVIEQEYIQAMIDSVHQHGPYIVLKDYFAMPHAKAGTGVNEVGMSLLHLEEPVDVMGNPVKVFVVLAAVDSSTHLEAMSELAELLMEDEKFDVVLAGDLDEIAHLLKEEEDV